MDSHTASVPALEVATGSVESWVLTIETMAPHDFRMTCEGSEQRRWTIETYDVFECLMRLRHQVEAAGWLLCCNGARRDSWSSGMARDMGGGWSVYLLEGVPKGQRPPLVPTLDPVLPELAATVAQQWHWYEEWVTHANPDFPTTDESWYSDWLQRVAETDA